MSLRHWKILITLLVVAGSSWLVRSAQAQTTDTTWQPPANLSNSGATSHPAIVAAPNGELHALWWDTTLGTMYAHTGASDSTWTQPAPVPAIVGRRVVDPQTNIETITAPRDIRLFADTAGNVYAFWYDYNDQLFSMVNAGNGWGKPEAVAEKALSFEAISDPSGRMHLVYIRPSEAEGAPAGIYYRSASDGNWSPAKLVKSSAYYRTLKPDQVHVSVAGDEAGNVLVAWDEPPLNQSMFAHSSDRGETWSEPQAVVDPAAGQARRAQVAFGPNKELLMQWQDANAGGCGMTQRRSSDAGQTWTTPEVILSTLTHCDVPWSFATDQAGRLWLISRPTGSTTNVVTVAVWDGTTWSEPRDVNFAFFDDRTRLSSNLNCLNLSIAGGTAGLLGCDAGNDVRATRNAIALDQWLPSLKRVWGQPQVLSAQTGMVTTDGVPDVIADTQGNVYAVWSQATSDGLGTDLYSAVWRDGRWSSTTRISPSGTSDTQDTVATVHQANQPTIAIDSRDRVHVVWSGGAAGEIFHSWAYARDLGGGQRWNEETRLSPPSALAQWPDIVADPRNSDLLYVLYTLPFNEQRGVYLSTSTDAGQSWQTPVKVFDAAAVGWDSVDEARLALDAENNILHAVWTRHALPGQTQPQEVYAASSRDGGKTWTTPLKIAEGIVTGPQVIVPAKGQVYLAWCQTDAAGPSVRGQFSPDGGQRWTASAAIDQFQQVNCPVSLATDGLGQMQLAGVTDRAGNESVLLTAQWNGQTWNAPESDQLGQRAHPNNVAAIALVPQANRLSAILKLWSQQAATADHFDIIATDRQAPAVGVLQPAPTFTPMPTPTVSVIATIVPTATPRPPLNARALTPPTTNSGPPPMVLGGGLAAIIVVVVVSRIIWMKRH